MILDVEGARSAQRGTVHLFAACGSKLEVIIEAHGKLPIG